MRPIKLQLNNFGPYDHATIDFSNFTESKLFLITGDTGAGKTTIFDGMTYALFGEGTGERRPEDMRSEFADTNSETKVIFWFEHNGRFYEIKRTPTQSLKKKRGAKSDFDLTEHKATVSLMEVDDVLATPIAALGDKATVVNDHVKDLLHLNAEQFRKIILLPQDKFREFLSAQSDDKKVILRQLFGTAIFDQFTDKLKQQQKTSDSQLEQLAFQRDDKLKQVDWQQDDIGAIAPTAVEKLTLLSQMNQAMRIALTEQENDLTKAREQLKILQQRQQEGQRVENLYTQLTQKNQLLQEKYTQKPAIEKKKTWWQTLRWAEAQREIVDKQQRIAKQLADESDSKQQITIANNQLKHSQAVLVDEQATLYKQKESIVNKRIVLQQIQNDLLPKSRQLAKAQDKQAQVIAKIASAEQTNQKLTDQLQVTENELTDKQKQLADKQQIIVNEISLTKLISQIQNLAERVSDYESRQSALESAELQVTKLAEQVAKSEEHQSLQLQKLKEQETLRRDILIQQLKQELQVGEPCLICGQIYQGQQHEHNQAATTTYADLKTAIQAVEQTEQSVRDATAQLSKVKTAYEAKLVDIKSEKEWLSSRQSEISQTFEQLKVDWESVFATFDEDFSGLPTVFDKVQVNKKAQLALAFMHDTKKQVASLEKEVVNKQQQLQAVKEDLVENKQILVSQQQNKQELTDEITQLTASTGQLLSVTEYEQKIQQLQNEIKKYEETDNELREQLLRNENSQQEKQQQLVSLQQKLVQIQADLTQEQQRLATAISEGPVADRGAFDELMARLNQNPDEINQLHDAVMAYQTSIKSLTAEFDDLKKQIGNKTLPDLEKLQVLVNEQQASVEQQVADYTAKKAKLTQQVQIEASVQTLQEQWEAQQAAGRDLFTLKEVVDGNNDKRLRLETFILRRFLYDVLEYANAHYIGVLSAGRYQFILSDRQAGRANQNGLDIDIYDQDGGKIRATSTLSGGESFIAALSIALSMAEIVQHRAGGAKIDALFIDEGFGSLDEQTLSQAMEALSMVEQSGRLVGIISHVSSMKQQIPQQLAVKKLGNGRSKLTLHIL